MRDLLAEHISSQGVDRMDSMEETELERRERFEK